MSRRPRLAVLVLLLLPAAGSRATASVCDQDSPAASAPNAPFRTDAPGALSDEQRARLGSLEDGRYEPRDGFLADRRESSRLTNAQTARLLCPPRDGRPEASPARLAAPKILAPARGVGALDFDGAGRRRADVEGAPGAGMSARSFYKASTEADPRLLREVLARVKFAEDSDPRAAAALLRAMRDVLRSPTGEEAAQDFVALNASAEVRFDKLDGALVSENGRKLLSGSLGETRSTEKGSVVALNRLYLDADPEISSREMAGTLAHELFGHSLEEQRAERARFPQAALLRYRGDEANGRLIGWLVRTELGAPLSDGDIWIYLRDPERFHEGLALISPYYAKTFSTAEMTDPLPVLRARQDEVRRRRGRMDDDAIDSRKWRIVVKHLIDVHGMEKRRFAAISEDIDNFLERELSGMRKDSDQVEKALQKRLDFYETPEGREQLSQLADAARSDYLGSFETRLARYRTRLGMQTRGRKPEPLTPPLPDQIDYDELEKLYQDDLRDNPVRDNPRHWGL